jgi:hypothetical protein
MKLKAEVGYTQKPTGRHFKYDLLLAQHAAKKFTW